MKKIIYILFAIAFSSCGIVREIATKEELLKRDSVDEAKKASAEEIIIAQNEANEISDQGLTKSLASAFVWPHPKPKYVFIFNLENRDKNDVYNNANAAYVRDFIQPFAVRCDNYKELNTTSQPNYKRFHGFTSNGIVDNSDVAWNQLPAFSLTTVLKRGGYTIKSWIQGIERIGDTRLRIGTDVRQRHTFAYGFKDTDPNTFIPYEQFSISKIANLNYMQLNERYNSHNTNVQTWSNFLKTDPVFQSIKNFCDTNPEAALILWTDERDDNTNGLVPIFIYGKMFKDNYVVTASLNHYSLSKLICNWFGQPGQLSTVNAPEFPTNIYETGIVIPPVDTTCYKIVPRTVTTIVNDTIKIPCDTTSSNEIWRGVYLRAVSTVIQDENKIQAVINDCKKAKFKYTFAYDIGNANTTLLGNFNQQLKLNGIVPGATFSSTNGINQIKTFNLNNPDGKDFDHWNSESEPWITDPIVTWVADEALIRYSNAQNESAQIDEITNYRGWPNQNNFIVLLENSTYGLYHDYQKVPSFGYLKSRIDNTETVAKNKNMVYRWRVIFSLESAFMLKWIKSGHTLDEAYMIVYNDWKKQGYTNNILDGYLCFTLDHWRAAQVTNTLTRSSEPQYSDSLFDPNYTDPKHINTAIPQY